jgi:hypothetical protein
LICIGLDVEFLKATGDVLGTRINRDWTRILGFFEIVGEHGFWDWCGYYRNTDEWGLDTDFRIF